MAFPSLATSTAPENLPARASLSTKASSRRAISASVRRSFSAASGGGGVGRRPILAIACGGVESTASSMRSQPSVSLVRAIATISVGVARSTLCRSNPPVRSAMLASSEAWRAASRSPTCTASIFARFPELTAVTQASSFLPAGVPGNWTVPNMVKTSRAFTMPCYTPSAGESSYSRSPLGTSTRSISPNRACTASASPAAGTAPSRIRPTSSRRMPVRIGCP